MSLSTRERLIDSSRRLFHEQGFEATGVAQVLRSADLHAGSLYHYFSGKQALLEGVLQRYEEQLGPLVMDPIEKTQSDPLERIFDLLAWYRAGMLRDECRNGCPVGNLALELSDRYPELRPRIDGLLRSWTARIRRWLDEASDQLPPGMDTEPLSHFVLTVMEGGLLQARAAHELTPYDHSVHVLRDYFNRLRQS